MNDLSLQPGIQVPAPLRTTCTHCVARDLCLPSGINGQDLALLAGMIGYRRRLQRDDILFRKEQPFAMIYAVRYGHLKSSRPDHHGLPHVTAFYMAGEVMGLDAIHTGRHGCTTTALEDSEVCEIPYAKFQQAMHDSPALMHRFHCAMSHEIAREQAVLLYADMNGTERLASLLLDLSARYAERGFSGRRFNLRMSRADIGDYLGLTIESVSRLLGRFRNEGWIALDKRDIELLDHEGLEALLTVPDDKPLIAQ